MKAGADRLPEARIDFIDGFRGIAILLVVAYHYFSFWGPENRNLYPYGALGVDFPAFKYGFYGVQLFFVVSGFVIAMTLERTTGIVDFAIRRFARLWPAMFLCSLITYFVLTVWPDYWPQRPINFLPSLTFLDGTIVWEKILPGLNAQYIEGAYWTLFVEVRFYFYAGLIYFLSTRRFSTNFATFSAVVVIIYCLAAVAGNAHLKGIVHDTFVAPYLPWFLGGIAAFDWSRGRRRLAVGLAAISFVSMIWLRALNAPDANVWVAVIVAGMFGSCFLLSGVRRMFAARWLSMVRLSSYSLYLLHQRIGVTLTQELSVWLGWVGPSSILISVAMLIGMILLSQVIYWYWEHPLNKRIVRFWANLFMRPSNADAMDSVP
jgi:peptidoglycan/LPS O-acetylase OafA/YrhL